jgi:nitroreductase
MELLEAVKIRRSIRAFKPDPVPKEIILELLGVATRAPSGVNSQPWEFFIISGKTLNNVRQAYVEQYRAGIVPNPDVTIPKVGKLAPKLQGIYKERQILLAKQIYDVYGITKENTKALHEYNESMYRFFDAPAILVIAFDRMLSGGWPILDIGSVAQTTALGTQAFGLGTCIMRAIVDFPTELRKQVGIPDSKQIIVGIAIGYPDWNHPVNQLKTEREALEKIVTFRE